MFIQSFILMIGGSSRPSSAASRRARAAGDALAGVSVTFISMRPALEMFHDARHRPVCFAIILVSWFGGVKYQRESGGPVAIAAGMLIAGLQIFSVSAMAA